MSKYRNRKMVYDNITFASRLECDFYITLCSAKKENKIKDFELQPKFILQEKFSKHNKKYREIAYIADFRVITNDGKSHIVDCKGMETHDFKLKKKMYIYKFDEPLYCLTYIKKYGGWIELDDYKKIKLRNKNK